MNEFKDKAKRAVKAGAGAVAAEVVGNELTQNSPGPAPAAAATASHDAPPSHEWVPETGTSSVTRGEDGSVEARTGTVWRPETHEGTAPPADLPTIEEFEQIDVREDEFGNFIIDATERVVVHNHGHDETYVDHQHVVVPGDGTPGDTDLDIIEREDVVVHENPDGTISVEHSGSLSVETHPDAPGHGDIEVWQEESVALDEAPTGPPGIDVGISEDEQAHAEDPFGEPAGPTIHQTETVGDKSRTVTSTVTVPAPSLPAPSLPAAPATASVAFTRPSTVETVETSAASQTLTEHPAVHHVEPKFHEPPVKHSFATDPPVEKHHPGEVSGPKPVEHKQDPEPPPVQVHLDPHVPEPPLPELHEEIPHDQVQPEETAPPEVTEHHDPIHHAHADGGG